MQYLGNVLTTGKETVTLIDGGFYMDSVEVFAMIRGSVSFVVCTQQAIS